MSAASPLPLSAFAKDARDLDAAAFSARHGDAFLIQSGANQQRLGQLKTFVVGTGDSGVFALGDSLVTPLRDLSPPITFGRAKSSAVVVADASVSSFHAALVPVAGGWAAHDGGSRNGTRVDGRPAPQRGEGEPAVLQVGKILRLGSVELMYADAALVVQLALLGDPAGEPGRPGGAGERQGP